MEQPTERKKLSRGERRQRAIARQAAEEERRAAEEREKEREKQRVQRACLGMFHEEPAFFIVKHG